MSVYSSSVFSNILMDIGLIQSMVNNVSVNVLNMKAGQKVREHIIIIDDVLLMIFFIHFIYVDS